MPKGGERTRYMERILSFIPRRLAMRRCVKTLPRRLRDDYGHIGPFTPAQVVRTVQRHRLSAPYVVQYAVAIFCDREAAEQAWRALDRQPDYEALRADVGGAYFSGELDFRAEDVSRHSAEHGAHGGHESHGGGHHGGGGEGHH